MKTLTLTLDGELEERLRSLALLEGRSESEILLEALQNYTSAGIPDWVGIAASSENLSERDETILQSEWR